MSQLSYSNLTKSSIYLSIFQSLYLLVSLLVYFSISLCHIFPISFISVSSLSLLSHLSRDCHISVSSLSHFYLVSVSSLFRLCLVSASSLSQLISTLSHLCLVASLFHLISLICLNFVPCLSHLCPIHDLPQLILRFLANDTVWFLTAVFDKKSYLSFHLSISLRPGFSITVFSYHFISLWHTSPISFI